MRILKFFHGKTLNETNPTWRHRVNWGSPLAVEEFHIYMITRDFPHWNASIPLFHQGSQCRLQLLFLQEMANFRWFDSVNSGKAMKSSPQGPTTNNPNEPLISTPHIFHLFPPYQTCETSFKFWISWGYITGTKLNQKMGGGLYRLGKVGHIESWEPSKKNSSKMMCFFSCNKGFSSC